MKYNDDGTIKEIKVKTFDTLPVGAIVEYSGLTIPSGWTDIGNNQIQKTSQYIEGGANLSNEYGTSNENGYTQEYINDLETYSTDEVRIGTWFGKPLYRKSIVKTGQTINNTTTISLGVQNAGDIAKYYYSFKNKSINFFYGQIVYEASNTPIIYMNTKIENGDIKFCFVGDNYFTPDANRKWVFTAEYTKTTD